MLSPACACEVDKLLESALSQIEDFVFVTSTLRAARGLLGTAADCQTDAMQEILAGEIDMQSLSKFAKPESSQAPAQVKQCEANRPRLITNGSAKLEGQPSLATERSFRLLEAFANIDSSLDWEVKDHDQNKKCQVKMEDDHKHLIRKLFEDIDTDGSGFICKDELLAVISDEGLSDEHKQLVSEIMTAAMVAADTDADGLLDYEEFLGLVCHKAKPKRPNILSRYPALVDSMLCIVFFVMAPCIFCNYNNDDIQWSVWDALYFATVTLSTVGYGDRVPVNDGMKIFTIFYIIFGLCAVAGFIESMVWKIVKYHEKNAKAARLAFAGIAISAYQKASDIKKPLSHIYFHAGLIRRLAHSVSAGFSEHEPKVIKHLTHEGAGVVHRMSSHVPKSCVYLCFHHDMVVTMLRSGFMFATPVLIGGWIMSHSEDWPFLDGVYWAVVTCTTVGYGDLSLKHESSRIFTMLFIMIGVVWIGAVISNIGRHWLERRLVQQKQDLLARSLSMDLLRALSLDKPGRPQLGLDKCDFVCALLVQLHMVDKEDLIPLLKKFDDMDLDKTGVLPTDEQSLKRIAARQRSGTKSLDQSSRSGSKESRPCVEEGIPDGFNAIISARVDFDQSRLAAACRRHASNMKSKQVIVS